MRTRTRGSRKALSLPLGTQNSVDILEDGLTGSYKTKFILNIRSSSPKGVWYVHTKTYTQMFSQLYVSPAKLGNSQDVLQQVVEKSSVVHPDNRVQSSAGKKRALEPWKDMEEL